MKKMDKNKLSENTWLSERQAELYILKSEKNFSITDAAQEMNIGRGNASQKWNAIKQKFRKSKRTVDLLDF